MTAGRWTLAVCQAISLGAALALPAQRPPLTLSGRVVRITPRGPRPAGAVPVILHRVGASSAGPVDSVVTDSRGRYRFRVDQPDSTAMYLPTTRHDGIAYFAPPVRVGDAGAGEIEVFDTTSAPVQLRVAGRHVVVSAPNVDGRREVVEVYELQNDNVVTRVGTPDRPAFLAPLPPGATRVAATRGDFTGEAVAVLSEGAGIVAPIPPGIRQLALTYQLPAAAFPLTVTLRDTSAVVEVLLEEPGARLLGDSLPTLGAVRSEGRDFVRYLGRDVPAGKRFTVEVGTTLGPSRQTSWVSLVALIAVALGAIAWTLMPRRRPALVAVVAFTPAQRARELRAAIDAVDLMLDSRQAAEASRESLISYRNELEAERDQLLAAPPDGR